jgi:GTP pyrophosphokinase
MPGRFKDYIAIPRVNGYQSLHTTLFGPNGVPIEAQIRTTNMHRVAEAGIAAHWKYKAGGDADSGQQDRTREWLSNLVSLQESGSSEEFLESVKVDLFPDKVYVFTPKGQILRLPSGATVVDFAYAVHTDIGNRCVAAKVDRRLTPLRTVLRNGQTVEIISAKGATPNPSWVNFVVTAKARSAIRHYLKSLRRSEAIALGAKLLAQALGEFSLSFEDVSEPVRRAALGELGMKDLDELHEKIGLGERLAPLVARRLLPTATHASGTSVLAPLAIAGTEGLLVTYARCCFPIPYDPIFAFLSSGRGVVIHRENCVNVEDYSKHPENWLPVSWQTSPDRLFSSELRVYVINRTGVLAAVAAAIASTETNIDHVSIDEQDSDTAVLTFELRVRDRRHLARLVRVIRRMPDVNRVTRSIAAHARSAREVDHDGDPDPDPRG